MLLGCLHVFGLGLTYKLFCIILQMHTWRVKLSRLIFIILEISSKLVLMLVIDV